MSLDFTFEVENIGIIKHAKIDIRSLTIIAGENNSGKSMITKSLYSIFKPLFSDLLSQNLRIRMLMIEKKFNKNYADSVNLQTNREKKFFESASEALSSIREIINSLKKKNLKDQILNNHEEIETIDFAISIITDYRLRIAKIKKYARVSLIVKSIENDLIMLKQIFKNKKKHLVVLMDNEITESFLHNFQIQKISNIVNHKEKTAIFKIDNLGKIEISQESNLDFDLLPDGVENIRKYSEVLFLDSPAYLKIRKAFQRLHECEMFLDEDDYLEGYPKYIKDIFSAIDKEYIQTPDFIDINNEFESLISGKINVSKSGEITFKDIDNHIIPISLTAMGIANLGLIDLLIRNNKISKGSFLIIDEPEAHLHPKWQIAIAKILFKIAKAGTNVIIATHSIDFLKTIEIILKKEKKASEIIAINKLPFEEDFYNADSMDRINKIMIDLSAPYSELYFEGI